MDRQVRVKNQLMFRMAFVVICIGFLRLAIPEQTDLEIEHSLSASNVMLGMLWHHFNTLVLIVALVLFDRSTNGTFWAKSFLLGKIWKR